MIYFFPIPVPLIETISFTEEETGLLISWNYTHTGGLPLLLVTVEFTLCENANCSKGFTPLQDRNLTNVYQTYIRVLGSDLIALERYGVRIVATNDLGPSKPAVADDVSTVGKFSMYL